MQSKKTILFFIFIMMLGLALRLIGITWGIPRGERYFQSFHPDEIGNLNSIHNTNAEYYKDYQKQWYYNKGTGMWFLWANVIYTGQSIGLLPTSHDITYYQEHPRELGNLYLAGRLVTVFCSIVSLVAIFGLGSALFSRDIGLLAALFLAILPAEVVNAHYMKTDVPAMMWALLAMLGVISCRRNGRIELSWGLISVSGICFGMAITAKYSMIILALPLLIMLIDIKKPFLKKNLPLIMVFLIAATTFALLSDMVLHRTEFIAGLKEQLRVQSHPPTGSGSWFYDFYLVLSKGLAIEAFILPMIIAFTILTRNRQWRRLGFLLSWAVLGLIPLFKGWLLVRYTVPLAPLIALTGAIFLIQAAEMFEEHRTLALILICLCLSAEPLLHTGCKLYQMTQKDMRLVAVEEIEKLITPGERIGLVEPGLYLNPAIDSKRFKLVDFQPDMYQFKTDTIMYFVYNPIAYEPDAPEQRKKFYKVLENPKFFKRFYALPASDPVPRIWPLDWSYQYAPVRAVLNIREFDGTNLPKPEGYQATDNPYFLLK